MLDRLRSILRPALRERAYVIVAAIVAVLTSVGLLEASEAAAWSSLIVSAITLAFALLHSTSPWRTALYSFLLGLQGIAGLYGIATEAAWALVVQVAAALLGITTAAAKTPTVQFFNGGSLSTQRRPIQ